MNRSRILKILLFLFALNSISLFFYFSSHSPHFLQHKRQKHKEAQDEQSPPPAKNYTYFHGKPWPILPSYLPWTLNPDVQPKSCESYFGNGFSRRIDVLPSPKSLVEGWFRCFHSQTLGSSICEGGRIRMKPEKIRMSTGGEKLESVIGRGEDEELPFFDDGAFDIEGKSGRKLVNQHFLDNYVPSGRIHRHTMRALLDSIRLVPSHEFTCSQFLLAGLVLFLSMQSSLGVPESGDESVLSVEFGTFLGQGQTYPESCTICSHLGHLFRKKLATL